MPKKGFTLVELLGVISVLAILALIVSAPVTKTIQEGNKKACESQVQNIETSAKMWGKDHLTSLPDILDSSININLGTLKAAGLVDKKIKNPLNKKALSDEMLIKITKKGKKYWEYKLVDGSAMCGGTALTEEEYVQSGLVIRYDGMNAPIQKNGKTVWQDLSGHGNDATLSGFSSNINSFWTSSSIVFDGQDDYMTVKNPFYTTNGSTHPITIEIIAEKGSKNEYAMLLSATDCVNSYHYLNLWATTEAIRSYEIYFSSKTYWNGVLANPVEEQRLRMTPSEAPLNKKQSFSYGVGSSNYFAYLNGTKKYDTAKQYSLGFHSDTIYIGRDHSASDTNGVAIPGHYPLDGKIYSIRIYDRQLSAAEIKQNYDLDKKRFNL